MSYIERKPLAIDQLTCTHPLVDKIWETGALAAIPTNGVMHRTIHIRLKDETQMWFSDKGDGDAINEAEKWLNSLPTKEIKKVSELLTALQYHLERYGDGELSCFINRNRFHPIPLFLKRTYKMEVITGETPTEHPFVIEFD